MHFVQLQVNHTNIFFYCKQQLNSYDACCPRPPLLSHFSREIPQFGRNSLLGHISSARLHIFSREFYNYSGREEEKVAVQGPLASLIWLVIKHLLHLCSICVRPLAAASPLRGYLLGSLLLTRPQLTRIFLFYQIKQTIC